MKIIHNDMKHQISEKLAICIAGFIIKVQHWFAKKLQTSTKNWRQQQRYIFLYLICLIFGGISMVIILQPFGSGEVSKPLQINFIRKNNNYKPLQKGFLITKEELQKVQQYKLGHPNLDKEIPGLYDSLQLIEQAYYSQQK